VDTQVKRSTRIIAVLLLPSSCCSSSCLLSSLCSVSSSLGSLDPTHCPCSSASLSLPPSLSHSCRAAPLAHARIHHTVFSQHFQFTTIPFDVPPRYCLLGQSFRTGTRTAVLYGRRARLLHCSQTRTHIVPCSRASCAASHRLRSLIVPACSSITAFLLSFVLPSFFASSSLHSHLRLAESHVTRRSAQLAVVFQYNLPAAPSW
jgi:hypothetical protein